MVDPATRAPPDEVMNVVVAMTPAEPAVFVDKVTVGFVTEDGQSAPRRLTPSGAPHPEALSHPMPAAYFPPLVPV
jgi:hypothetical protein